MRGDRMRQAIREHGRVMRDTAARIARSIGQVRGQPETGEAIAQAILQLPLLGDDTAQARRAAAAQVAKETRGR